MMKSNNYFKTILLSISTLILVFSTSCGGDDDTSITNTFSFEGNNYSVDEGEIYDYGAVNYVDGGSETHYNYDFFTFEGNLDVQNESFNGSFIIYVELLSAGTADFQPGTFSYIFPSESSEVDGVNYFEYADMLIDGNGDNDVEDLEDPYYIVFDGTIEVVDNGNDNYTLTYDLDIIEYNEETESFVEGSETELEFSATIDYDYFDVSENIASRSRGLKKGLTKRNK